MSGQKLKALVIGGGFSGMTAAMQLRKTGAEVDLVEIDPGWRSYGAGISLGGATMRALRDIGVLDAFVKHGYAADGVDLYTPTGHKIASLPTPRIAGPDVPGAGAILRPTFAALLAEATRASGANVRLGVSFTKIESRGEKVHVTFTDGTASDYDVAIGADGLYSKTRTAIFPDAPAPRYTGQCVWRAVLARFPEVEAPMMWLGDKVKVGVNPVSRDEMYIFVTEDRPNNDHVDPARFTELLKGLLARFPAPLVRKLNDEIGEHSRIVYRPLEGLLLPRPWSRDRVVLIGDAAHATTPHMASGACIGIEDGIVLAQELARGETVGAGLHAFEDRRYERCRMVVENSLRLGELEIGDGDKAEHAALMGKTMMALAAPI